MEKSMNCPHCNTQLKENELSCPKCKKVLRLQCPTCKNITKKTICEKCGNVILNKCYKCGKLNPTTLNQCPNCGLDINASIGLRESIIEEFAVLTVEITNFDDFKSAFKSDVLTKKFKQNLYSVIKKTAEQKQLRVQFSENTFIIRFCKDLSFQDSCLNAVDFSVYIAQTVTEINKKLFNAKGIALRTQMAIQKRDVYSKPPDFKSGININVVYSSSGSSHLFHNIEVVADSFIYQETKDKFPYQSLSAVQIKHQMVMYFELILHKIIHLKQEKDIETSSIDLPKNLDYEPEEDIEDKNLITFKNLNCSFIRAKGENIKQKLTEIETTGIQNPIVSIKREKKYSILQTITTKELESIFKNHEIKRFSCNSKTKYTPYGLLKSIILETHNITEQDLLADSIMREAISKEPVLINLFNMKPQSNVHPEDIKFTYYEAFTKFLQNIEKSTIYVIEDFENADETSIEILRYIFENNLIPNIGFIVSHNTDFSLHRKIYKLMTANNYYEIELKPSSNRTIVKEHLKQLKDIKNTFFIEKILENTQGSRFYFQQALEYLLDNEILENKNNKYQITKDEMLVIPKELNDLVQKRILHLKTTNLSFELFASLVLLGEKTPVKISENLGFKNSNKILSYLEQHNLIEINNEKTIIIKNYNLYKNNLLKVIDKKELTKLCQNITDKIYTKISIPNVTKAEILELCNLKKEAFREWHSLADISSKIGDFCAYLNCTNKFLSLVDNVIDEETDKSVEEVKMDIYAELASMLYKYHPDKAMSYLQTLLSKLEQENNSKEVKDIANKLVQTCLISGNYNHALDYIGKVISRTQKGSFNPKDNSFSINYFLVNLVTLEIYFNLGRFNECIELGEELLKYINFTNADDEELLQDKLSKKDFIESLIDANFFVNVARIIQLKTDRKEKLQELIESSNYNYTCFELLMLINNILEGKDVNEKLGEISQKGINDKYSQILFPFIQGLLCMYHQKWELMGNYIHNAKTKAISQQQHQMNYLCDLMIGFAYLNKGNNKKAKEIFYSVLDTATDKGLKNIITTSWYLIAKSEYLDNNKNIAIDILNKALLKAEKDQNSSDFFLLLYKTFLSEIILNENNTNEIEKLKFLAEHAYTIAIKKQIFTTLPLIAEVLIVVYTAIINSTDSDITKQEYQMKVENIKFTMAQITQQA